MHSPDTLPATRPELPPMSPDMIDIIPSFNRYRGPDGVAYSGPWWEAPKVPSEHVSQDVIPSFISQVDQADGIQSCFLTSQINGLIATAKLDSAAAEALQEELSTSDDFKRFWPSRGNGSDQRAWTQGPYALAFILDKLGTRIGTEFLSTKDGNTAELAQRLSSGQVAAITGRAQSGFLHTRFAFEPKETPGHLYVHDPKYPEVSGFYSYDQLPELHVFQRAVIF